MDEAQHTDFPIHVKEITRHTCSKSEASKVGSPKSSTATRKFLTFSKYWNADNAAPSGTITESHGASTT